MGDLKELQNKLVFEQALAGFYSVHLAVAFHPKVELPEFLKTPAWLDRKDVVHLEYGLDMPVPITDMVVTESGIAATLSFSRSPYHTFVPWEAVVGFEGEGVRSPSPAPKFKLKSV